MDFSLLENGIVGLTILGCLVIGYIIKHATFLKWIPNDDIPVILACFGAIINCFVSGLNIESIIYGAIAGLSSTGLHQAFKTFIEGKSTNEGGNH